MRTYSEEAMSDIARNFKIEDLKADLQAAEDAFAVLPGFIAKLKQQIKMISKLEFKPLLVFCRSYKVLLLDAPSRG